MILFTRVGNWKKKYRRKRIAKDIAEVIDINSTDGMCVTFLASFNVATKIKIHFSHPQNIWSIDIC